MSRFELTPPDRADLLEIWIYLVENASIDRADRVIASLQKAMNKLARTPGLGHLHHDLANESLRAYVVYSYLIIYRPDERPLQIIRVLHGARDLASLLGQNP